MSRDHASSGYAHPREISRTGPPCSLDRRAAAVVSAYAANAA